MSTTFAELGVAADQCAALSDRGITQPFPIQAATISDGLAGRDVCGRAPTGSGKTLAFGIPLVHDLDRARSKRPRALVLAPTRELAGQISDELILLAGVGGQRVLAVYGGVGYGKQRAALARGVEVLVACPGRLEDLLAQGALSLADVTRVVVDEADRMADMGFLPAVRRLLDATSPERQTLLFSATLDSSVDQVRNRYQRDPVHHDVSGTSLDGSVRHELRSVVRDRRVEVTAAVVEAHGPTIVFCRTRRGVDRTVKQLKRSGLAAAALHGGRNQNQRSRALDDFTRGRTPALVATDVAARGIHVDQVACVIHYDPAPDAETYVHRSGRTGRAGAEGLVVTLAVDDEQNRTTKRILRALRVDAVDSAARNTPASAALDGQVKFYDHRRGFGFIAHADHGDVFVHRSHLSRGSEHGLKTGQRVRFEIGRGRKGHEARKVLVV